MSERTLFGDLPRFAGGLQDLGGGVHAWMQPNGAWGESNAGLVVGDGESLLVDTLWDLLLTRRMLDAMRDATHEAPIRYLVNTHSDGDHCWGNELVSEARIISSRASAEAMGELTPADMARFARLGSVMRTLGGVPFVGPGRLRAAGRYFRRMQSPFDYSEITLTPPSQTFAGSLTLEVGGRAVQLIEVGPAHTAGDLLVHVSDARTVFAGDIVFLGSTPVMWAGPVDGWIAALDRLLELDVDTVVPGHGPVTDKDGARAIRDYWSYLDTEARRRFDQGMPALAAAGDILRSPDFGATDFAGWDCPERIAINVNTIYRWLQGEPPSTGALERVRVFAALAQLAEELAGSAPAALHPPAEIRPRAPV